MNIFGLHSQKLSAMVEEHFPKYRAKQLLHWLYQKHIFVPEEMTDLPAPFKTWLHENFSFTLPKIIDTKRAKDGSSKYLLELEDGAKIEMVLIPDKQRSKLTLCVSSQVGCSRACSFCATGSLGLARNLETHEIISQILLAQRQSPQHRISNLVFMGMGEPLDNLPRILAAIQIIQASDTFAFSPRRITISTCGLAPQIITLAQSGIRCKLAVSLNSAIPAKRSRLMPVNDVYPLQELKSAIISYLKHNKFRVTFEYILIPGLNMADEDIKALKKYVGDLACKLNFIPYNPVDALPFRPPTEAEIESFMAKAQSLNQAITLRRSRGAEVCGACGQLAGTI